MNGFFRDSAIHAIARYLIKYEDFVKSEYDGKLDLDREIRELNQQYRFVSENDFTGFKTDIRNMHVYELNRQPIGISDVSYAKFKLDQAMGINTIQRLKNELKQDIVTLPC